MAAISPQILGFCQRWAERQGEILAMSNQVDEEYEQHGTVLVELTNISRWKAEVADTIRLARAEASDFAFLDCTEEDLAKRLAALDSRLKTLLVKGPSGPRMRRRSADEWAVV